MGKEKVENQIRTVGLDVAYVYHVDVQFNVK